MICNASAHHSSTNPIMLSEVTHMSSMLRRSDVQSLIDWPCRRERLAAAAAAAAHKHNTHSTRADTDKCKAHLTSSTMNGIHILRSPSNAKSNAARRSIQAAQAHAAAAATSLDTANINDGTDSQINFIIINEVSPYILRNRTIPRPFTCSKLKTSRGCSLPATAILVSITVSGRRLSCFSRSSFHSSSLRHSTHSKWRRHQVNQHVEQERMAHQSLVARFAIILPTMMQMC